LRAELLELVASLGVEAVEIRIHGNEPCAAETKKSIPPTTAGQSRRNKVPDDLLKPYISIRPNQQLAAQSWGYVHVLHTMDYRWSLVHLPADAHTRNFGRGGRSPFAKDYICSTEYSTLPSPAWRWEIAVRMRRGDGRLGEAWLKPSGP
jgi:hypothetical protein